MQNYVFDIKFFDKQLAWAIYLWVQRGEVGLAQSLLITPQTVSLGYIPVGPGGEVGLAQSLLIIVCEG